MLKIHHLSNKNVQDRLRINSYGGLCSFLHISGTLPKATSDQMASNFETWLHSFIRLSGLQQHQVTAWCVHLVEPVSHFHAVVWSRRDRRSGRDITRQDAETFQKAVDQWPESSDGENLLSIRRGYDLPDLVAYLAGPKNVSRPGQRTTELIFNEKLFNKRLKS